MKKLIALAVAAASMPAMAAVSVSGSYNVEYVDDNKTQLQPEVPVLRRRRGCFCFF